MASVIIHADNLARRADHLFGNEAVEAATGAHVQKGLSRMNRAQTDGVAHSRK